MGSLGYGPARSSGDPRLPMLEERTMPERESIFHRYTAFLARRADGIVLGWTIAGGVVGLLLGAVTLTGWSNWPVSHGEGYLVALLGAVSGAFLGRAIGSGRAQMVLFQAQLAQHQLEFERRLLALGAAVPQPQPHRSLYRRRPSPRRSPAPVEPVALPAPLEPVESLEPAVPLAPAPPEPVVEEPVAEAPALPATPEPAPVYFAEPPLAFALPELPELPRLPDPEAALCRSWSSPSLWRRSSPSRCPSPWQSPSPPQSSRSRQPFAFEPEPNPDPVRARIRDGGAVRSRGPKPPAPPLTPATTVLVGPAVRLGRRPARSRATPRRRPPTLPPRTHRARPTRTATAGGVRA